MPIGDYAHLLETLRTFDRIQPIIRSANGIANTASFATTPASILTDEKIDQATMAIVSCFTASGAGTFTTDGSPPATGVNGIPFPAGGCYLYIQGRQQIRNFKVIADLASEIVQFSMTVYGIL